MSALEAEIALTGLDADGARLAHGLPIPWGHLLAGGMLMAVLVGVDMLSAGWMAATTAATLLGTFLVGLHYRTRYGVVPAGPIGRRSTWLLVFLLVALLLAKVAVMVIADTGISPWGAALPMIGALAVTLLFGARYHLAMREVLAHRLGRRL
ncbi:MAG: hypothetical protein L0H74_09565 [Brachybacterium sp.]|nr:hypothetical protein [Brachybacterium sp.]